MRKLALVLVAVLLLVMVGACGETGPTEGSEQLDQMFTNFIEAVANGYADNYYTVIKDIRPSEGPERFTEVDVSDDFFYEYAYGYNRALKFDGLQATLIVSKTVMGESLSLMFARRDNPGADSMDDLNKQVAKLCKSAFPKWDAKKSQEIRTIDWVSCVVKATSMPSDGVVMVVMEYVYGL